MSGKWTECLVWSLARTHWVNNKQRALREVPLGKHNIFPDGTLRDNFTRRGFREAKEYPMVGKRVLRQVTAVGPVLGLVLLYELHDIGRFATVGQFLSYARLVRCAHESAGKKQGSGGKKIGDAHLRWAFGEAVCPFLRASERAKKGKLQQTTKRGEG